MGRTGYTEPQCLYKGALYLFTWGTNNRSDSKRKDYGHEITLTLNYEVIKI